MIEMRVGQDHGIDGMRGNRRGLPVAFTPLFWPLKHAAVDQDLKTILSIEVAAGINQVFGTSDSPGGAKKLNVGQSSLRRASEKLSQQFHLEGTSAAATLKVLLLKSLSGTLPSFTVT